MTVTLNTPTSPSAIPEGLKVAYFSMEIGLKTELPTYSGGLGVLAGDSLRAAADLGLPVCGVTLLYRKGYFRQQLDAKGHQTESPILWNPEDLLEPVHEVVTVPLAGREVKVRAFRYDIKGARGHIVPVYFLDTAIGENSSYDQSITDSLYGGDDTYRLTQEAILGWGGVALLEALGMPPAKLQNNRAGGGISVYHMNEGHSALLTLALLKRRVKGELVNASQSDCQWARDLTVFTTHTPVPAGHDTFSEELVAETLGGNTLEALKKFEVCANGRLNMSHLAIRFSRYVNGVAKRHAEVSREMFPSKDFNGIQIQAITNGVHAVSWTSDAIQELYDRFIPGWREDNNYLRYAIEIPTDEVLKAHQQAKNQLLKEVAERTGSRLDAEAFTIGFARRAAEYKRADLLFQDLMELKKLAKDHKIQVIYAGKAHPKDAGGKSLIEKVFAAASELQADNGVRVVYLENYDMKLGRLICSGVDLWLNNPVKPLEASGTSGMKAALNGIPSFSTLDGWWVEGCIDGVTGWEIIDQAYANIGDESDVGSADAESQRAATAAAMYEILGSKIVPIYYENKHQYAQIMRQAMALNGSYFNTHRMMQQYVVQAYST